MRLRTRFSAAFIGHTLLVVLLFVGAYLILERRAILQAQREEQLQNVEKIASVCRAMFMASSPVTALNYFRDAKKDPSIIHVACLDAKGMILAHSDSNRIGHRWEDAESARLMTSPAAVSRRVQQDKISTIDWVAPILMGGNHVGLAQVAYNEAWLRNSMYMRLWSTLRQLIAVAAGTFVLALVVGLVLAWTLSRPLGKVFLAVREYGQGHLDYQTPVLDRGDEIGELAQEMNRMAQQLQKFGEIKDSLISTVSHDLRGPLSAISMYATYLLSGERGTVNEKQERMLNIIKDSSNHLGIFVNNILEHAKMKAGMMQFTLKPCRLDEIVKPILDLFALTARLRELEIESSIASDLPPVLADAERLEQVFNNLITNAIKFTRAGGKISIRAALSGDWVRVSVADTGMGIAPEEIKNLFQKFQQLDVALQKSMEVRGTGLGLWTSQQTIDAHGGKIWAESKLGTGTTFYFTLAVAKEASHA